MYDIAIIGGGIAGAGIAREATLRGLKVILFEKNTFGSGTSGKSSKLIHGGIRYLETAWNDLGRGRFADAWKNFRFVFLSLKECRTLEKIAPNLVHPLPLVVPIYKNGRRNRWTVYAGTCIYFILAAFSGGAKCPRILWTKKSVLKRLPGLKPEGLVGGILLWDRLTEDAELVRETLWSAAKSGAEIFEHAEATHYGWDAAAHCFRVEVARNGRTEHHEARKLINASGPWVDKIRAANGSKEEKFLLPLAGAHATFRRFLPYSAILEAEDNRVFFVINIGETSRVGTTERPYADPDSLEATEEEIDYLLRSLKKYFPALSFEKSGILNHDAGIRPLARPRHALPANDISREHEIRVDADGVIHVLGVKLTDHRRAAEEIIDELAPEFRRYGVNVPKSPSARIPLA